MSETHEQRSVARGLAFLAVSALVLVYAGLLIASRFEVGRPRNIILVVACIFTGVSFSVLGVRALRRPRPAAPGTIAPDYRHIARLFGATILVMATMGLVLDALVPESYGLIGSFRADALKVATEREPVHLGESSCVDCHAKEVGLHDKDAHARVACEVCHGPGQKHEAFRKSDAGKAPGLTDAAVPKEARMILKKEREWCLRCHEQDPARPKAFPQIVWAEHTRVIGVTDPGGPAAPSPAPPAELSPGHEGDPKGTATLPCLSCHDPHEPLFMDRDLRNARLHPLVHRCKDCHDNVDQAFIAKGTPEVHPVTFQCSYCHTQVADEFTRSPHNKLECTTCHVYFKESSFAGRIIRDADPRFCLLCHKRTDYRRADGPKTISWPGHRETMRTNDQDTRTKCVECHHSAFHYPPPPKAEVDVDSLFGDDEAKPDDKKPDEAKPDEAKPDEAKPDDKKPNEPPAQDEPGVPAQGKDATP